MAWLRRKFGGRKAKKMEKKADKSEARVEELEERGAAQQTRLDKATDRVNGSIGQIKHLEQLAKRKAP